MSDRRFDCCPCCKPGGVGHDDHVQQGGWVERDSHEGPCTIHQTPNGSPKPVEP